MLAEIDRLIDALNKTPNIRATAVVLPVDVRPSAMLRGSPVAQETDRVLFTLKIVRSQVAA